MQLQATHFTSIEAPELRLGGAGHDGRHQVQVTISGDGHLFLYASAAELSELGHRLIELAAIAEEREQGVEAVA